ncbi:MAG: SDR family NAD(P)-dependent oxidoreductase [Rhizobiaceae bacterium]|nr:SDR family NAD(P)-dependent oxidoreductase [Rhizobiaceae bacterium]
MSRELAPPPRRNPLVRTPLPQPMPAFRARATHALTAAAAEGRFALQRCPACGRVIYPAHDACPGCLSPALVVADVPSGGRIVAETSVRAPLHPHFRQRSAWRIGIVHLDCGPSIVAHLHGDCGDGERVRMTMKLDKAGTPAAFALPETETPHMQDDPQLREFTASPKHRRVLITDGRTAAGQAMVRAMIEAGVAKLFIGLGEPWKPLAEDAIPSALKGVEIVPLDLGDDASVRDLAADIGGKVDILVNTAEHIRPGGLVDQRNGQALRDGFETTVMGLARLARAFGPAMRSRGADGTDNAVAWVNLLSVYALVNWPEFGLYSAGQAAALSIAQSLRAELRPGGIRVVNVFSGPGDTEWFQHLPPPKVAPAVLARETVAALREGLEDVYVGEIAKDIKARLEDNPKAVERELG